MKKTRFTEAQIMAVLRQMEGGVPAAELCREHGQVILPFEGSIDWSSTIQAIGATRYPMPLNLETPSDRHKLPELAFYRRVEEAAVRLQNMVRD